jgi:hypothetical protein
MIKSFSQSKYSIAIFLTSSLLLVSANGQRKAKESSSELARELKNLQKTVATLRVERDEFKKRHTQSSRKATELSQDLLTARHKLDAARQASNTSFVNGWVYDPSHGWLYTDSKVYPSVFSNQSKSWYRYETGSSKPRVFYNYKRQSRETWDHNPQRRGESGRGKQASIPKPPPETSPIDKEVDPEKELMITHLGVMEDPVRTNPEKGSKAVWTFKHLITQMAGKNDPAQFALEWLKLWEVDQRVNGKLSSARPGITATIIEPWLSASGGDQLDLNIAPFKLLAIANRMDLRVHDPNSVTSAGEGRFVFGVLKPDGTPLPPLAGPATGAFTVIFEYELGAKNMKDINQWARSWHDLNKHELGSTPYNKALEKITRRFTDKGRAPSKPNRNAINQIRTNEFSFGPNWELREFVLNPRSGMLRQHTVALTPDSLVLNGTQELADLINENEDAIMADTFDFPPSFLAAGSTAGPFLTTDFTDFEDRTFTTIPLGGPFVDIPWSADGIRSNEARHRFALNTCHGCHRSETNTGFLQIGFPSEHDLPRSLKNEAQLAAFLTGGEVKDPLQPEQTRVFNDLERRAESLQELLEHLKGKDGQKPPRKAHRPRFVH